MDQTNSKFPNGWVSSKLEEIARLNPRHPSNLDPSGEISFVPMPAVNEKGWKLRSSQKRPLSEVRNGYTHFADGDVLFAKITPCMENGKAGVAEDLVNGLGCGTTELHVIRPCHGVESKFLYYFIHREDFRKTARQSMTGTAGQLRVPLSFLKESILPVPPAAEQRRIIAKLEKLLAKVDACKERLEKIPVILKRFRQSVLAAAFGGRLTSDMRTHFSNSQWRIAKFGDLICDGPKNGLYKPQSFYGTGVQIVRIENFYDGKITSLEELKRLRVSDKELHDYSLENDDLLINRVNSMQFLGKSCLVRGLESPCVFESNIMRIRVKDELVLPEYLIAYLNSSVGLNELRKNAKHAVNQSSINQQDVQDTHVVLPSVAEQATIVQRLNELFQLSDKIQNRFQRANIHVDRLTQSILAKAFRGELVPQDPDDEPAAELLKRIQAERKNQADAGGPGRRGSKRGPKK